MDPTRDNTPVLRSYVPIVQNQKTIALLCGVIELENFPTEMLAAPYGGKAAVYIVEGENGNFLVDTWHPGNLGNIWSLGERNMAPGYDHEQLKQGLIDGESDYVVFVSRTTGEYLYFYYEPMKINDWRIALSVPREVVFSRADGIRTAVNHFLILEVVCFFLYFIWMFSYVRRDSREKQRQLDTINYIYDVEKLLFNAHVKRSNIAMALEKISQIISAECAGFWMPGNEEGDISFVWNEKKGQIHEVSVPMKTNYELLKYFLEGHDEFEAYDKEALNRIIPDGEADWIQNMMAVPIVDGQGRVSGILAACNMSRRWENISMLKSVGLSFSMFCRNIRSYNAMRDKGEKDLLTGLYNRNRYERDCVHYKTWYHSSLACFYIDVNGLHELNNSQGHEVGDGMLRRIAGQLLEKFGMQHTYRIGGDEFLAFVADQKESLVYQMGEETESALEEIQIHASVGVYWSEEISSIQELVKEAEKKMYQSKKLIMQRERKIGERKRIIAFLIPMWYDVKTLRRFWRGTKK